MTFVSRPTVTRYAGPDHPHFITERDVRAALDFLVAVEPAKAASIAEFEAALAPRRNRWLAAGIGGATAVAASYPGWRTRMAALSRYGQTRSGFVEDALVLLAAGAVVRLTQRPAGG